MATDLLTTLGLMLALLALKGFFSGAELAFVSADRARLRHRAASGSSGAKLALKLLENPTRLLTLTLIGTNITSVALTTVGAFLMVRLFADNGEWIALLVFTPLFLILGEIVPKSVYQQKADQIAPVIAVPLAWLRTVLAPLIWAFSLVAGAVTRLVGGRPDGAGSGRDEIAAAVSMAERAGALAAFRDGQVRRVLDFAQMTAADAMWPLDQLSRADRSAPMQALARLRRDTGQRLIPLTDRAGGAERVAAAVVLERWDVMDPELDRRSVAEFLKPLRVAPPDQRVSEIFELLHGAPDAVVVVEAEDGRALGLITLNALVRRTLGVEADPARDRAAAG